MSERFWKEVKEFIGAGIIGLSFGVYFAWACGRDIDREIERECGVEPYAEAPEYCQGFWRENGFLESTTATNQNKR
ncbi:hypothetical protein J6Z39_09035 [bacterium]|nr:hypothetical protein [bacterium]MBP5435947.1 hypothetical protein [bacterium]